MTEWIWLNGNVIRMSDARIGVEDRGFQFADGVYEVIKLYAGKPFTLDEHLARLDRSAEAIQIRLPLKPDALAEEIRKFVAKTSTGEGMIYLQLTRGVAPRNHIYPAKIEPTLLFYARPLPVLPEPAQSPGAKLFSAVDERWKKCWIKSIALLPNSLAKNAAVAAGADEAVFIDDGHITECSASNFYAIIDGALVTHPVGPKVLPGITRAVLLDLAPSVGIKAIERPISEAEARKASECFITSTTREISWVSHWDGREIGKKIGPLTLRLAEALREKVQAALAADATSDRRQQGRPRLAFGCR